MNKQAQPEQLEQCVECRKREESAFEFYECLSCGAAMCDECMLDHEDQCE